MALAWKLQRPPHRLLTARGPRACSASFARDRESKHAESPFAAHLNSGYEFMSQVRPSTGTADQKESLQITAREGAMDGRWPHAPESLQPAAQCLMDASHGLACRILNLLEP